MTVQTPQFSRVKQSKFNKALRANVNAYFKDKGIAKGANAAMVFKTVFHITLWVAFYAAVMFSEVPVGVRYALWAGLGFFITQVSVNIGHDAIHGAYSSKKWVNDLLSHTFNLNGASAYMWKRMHNVAHHTYTNVDGYDGDIEPFPLIRISPYAKYAKVHKWQYIYAYFFYGLGTLSWVFIKDYVKFFQNKVGNYNGQDHPRKEYFYLFFYKFLNYTLYLAVPFIFIDLPWYHILGGFLVMHWVSGFCLASIFMLAHALEQVTFDKPDENGNLRDSFHTHQLSTTVNFATKSKLAAFLTGGLNQQVEHHLFPAICSCHYPALADIVKETAEEYEQPYQELTFKEALASHNGFLKDMGDERFMGI